MGAQMKRILSLTIAGFLVIANGTVAEASTIRLTEETADTTVEQPPEQGIATDSEDVVEALQKAALGQTNGFVETGPDDTGPGDTDSGGEQTAQEPEEEEKNQIEITENEEGQTVYRLLSDVTECVKIELKDGETAYLEGGGNTIETNDNGIYASGDGTLVVSDVAVLGGDNMSGIGVLDQTVNITLSGTVGVQEFYFGGNQLTIAEDADVTVYGRGAHVQSLYYIGNAFVKEANSKLTLVQAGYEQADSLASFKHLSILYGDEIGYLTYVTDQDTVLADVLLPILNNENRTFKGWYSDGQFEEQYEQEIPVEDGMSLFAKYVNQKGKTDSFTETEELLNVAETTEDLSDEQTQISQETGTDQTAVTEIKDATEETQDAGDSSQLQSEEQAQTIINEQIQSTDQETIESTNQEPDEADAGDIDVGEENIGQENTGQRGTEPEDTGQLDTGSSEDVGDKQEENTGPGDTVVNPNTLDAMTLVIERDVGSGGTGAEYAQVQKQMILNDTGQEDTGQLNTGQQNTGQIDTGQIGNERVEEDDTGPGDLGATCAQKT